MGAAPRERGLVWVATVLPVLVRTVLVGAADEGEERNGGVVFSHRAMDTERRSKSPLLAR